MLTKTLKFDQDVLDTIKAAQWGDDGKSMTLVGQLDRKLYEKVNKALEAMGGKWNKKAKAHLFAIDPRPQVEGLLDSGSLNIERDGFFETPHDLAIKIIEMADINILHDVLEPSAGMGAIARPIIDMGIMPDVCEKNPDRAAYLADHGMPVVGNDFLAFGGNVYDRIVMNPPFEEGQDILHVMHAYGLLDYGGRLVSIMSEGPFFQTDNRSINFRSWLKEVGGHSEQLPPESFKSSGTNVNTRVVVIDL